MLFDDNQLTATLRAYMRSEEFRGQDPDTSGPLREKILRYAQPFGNFIEVHDILPRCMGRLQEMITETVREGNSLPSGTVVVARRLLQGCGRFDRQWFAPEGGLWMAVAWADTLLPEFSRLLPLAAGIAGCEAVRQFGINAAVKWVNDIQVGGRKVGGVLCETTAASHPADRYHLIGIGINCNNTSFPEELQESATSMGTEGNGAIDLEQFTLVLLARLAWNLGLVHVYEEWSLAWEKDGKQGFPDNPVVEAWKKVSDTLGRKVVYGYDVVRNPLYRATVEDIDHSGALVMRMDSGTVVTENSGEVMYLAE